MTLMNVCSLTPFPLFHCPESKPKQTNATKRKPSAAALPEGESLIDQYPLRWRMDVCSLTPFPLFHCPESKPKQTNATKRKPSAAALPEGESLIDPYPLRWHARAFTDSLPPSIIPLFLTLGTSGLAQKATDPGSKRKKVAAGSSGLTEPEREKGRKEADDREQGGSDIMSAA